MAPATLEKPMSTKKQITRPHYLDDDALAEPVVDPSIAAALLAKRKSAAAELQGIIERAKQDAADALAEREAKREAHDVALENLNRAAAEMATASHQVRAVSWRAEQASKRPIQYLKQTADGSIADMLARVQGAIRKTEALLMSSNIRAGDAVLDRQQAQSDALRFLSEEAWKIPFSADELSDKLRGIALACGLQ